MTPPSPTTEVSSQLAAVTPSDKENSSSGSTSKIYTQLKHGVLHHFDLRPLPICICSEILDSWPIPNHEYVGFQQAIKDAAEED